MTSVYRDAYDAGYDAKLKYNPNSQEYLPPQLKIIGGTVRGIATGIGLASEAVHYAIDKRKGRATVRSLGAPVSPISPNDLPAGQEVEPQHHVNDDNEDVDSIEWHLDEASTLENVEQAVYVPPVYENVAAEWSSSLALSGAEENEASVNTVLAANAASTQTIQDTRSVGSNDELDASPASDLHTPAGLPHPIVLPQRRPGTKSRGFIRAYAPSLSATGISSATFLTFLKELHKASQASPIFDILILGASIGGFYPDIIAQATSTAVMAAAMAGQEVQERWRTNKFLDRVNKEIFVPRGLYAMIVMYKPVLEGEEGVQVGQWDMAAQALVKYGGSVMSEDTVENTKKGELKQKLQRLRIDSGKSSGGGGANAG